MSIKARMAKQKIITIHKTNIIRKINCLSCMKDMLVTQSKTINAIDPMIVDIKILLTSANVENSTANII